MTRGAVQLVTAGELIDAAYPPYGWWEDWPGCGRYTSSPVNNPKNITALEIERAAQMGHGFMWFVEQSEVTPINDTREDDRRLANVASQMAEDHQVADGTPFMFAVDTNGRPYMDNVRSAFVLYRQIVPARFPCGAYADSFTIDQLIDDGTIEYGQIPAAYSWSSTTQPVDNVMVFRTRGVTWYRTPAAHLLQFPSEDYKNRGRIDRNEVTPGKGMPVWFPGGTTPTPPQPIGGDVSTLITVQGLMMIVSPSSPPVHTHASWVQTEAEVNELNGIPEVAKQSISSDQCHGIRMLGPCPAELRSFFHKESPFDGQASLTVPPHTHSFSGSVAVTGTTGPAQ